MTTRRKWCGGGGRTDTGADLHFLPDGKKIEVLLRQTFQRSLQTDGVIKKGYGSRLAFSLKAKINVRLSHPRQRTFSKTSDKRGMLFFGRKGSVKENHQGFPSRSITRRSGALRSNAAPKRKPPERAASHRDLYAPRRIFSRNTATKSHGRR